VTSREIKRKLRLIRRLRYLIESGKVPYYREYALTSLAAQEAHLQKARELLHMATFLNAVDVERKLSA
jgi:hypothetical protein